MLTRAIARHPGSNSADGLTSFDLGTPDLEKLRQQHAAYLAILRDLGLRLDVLEAEVKYPDGYFVEDVAIVTDEVAVITRPGAKSRLGEEDSIEPILSKYRPIARIEAPGTVEGGDVLQVGRRFFIGISERTNMAGAKQLGTILERFGYQWQTVGVVVHLHLKSSVNTLDENTLILTDDLARNHAFSQYAKVILDQKEHFAANTLQINDQLIIPLGFPTVREKLTGRGYKVIELDVSEIRKMDGGLTCMSLRF